MYKLIFISLTLILFSCNSTKNMGNTDVDYRTYLDGEWTLVQLNDRVMDASMTRPTITVSQSGSRVSGNGGCNNFASTLEAIGPNTIEMGDIAATKMACPSMSVETEYFKTLGDVATYKIEGSTLMLMSKGGKELLSFSRI